VAYRLIRGEPLVDEDADGVRAFLSALHSFDPAGLGVPQPDWRGIYRAHASNWRRVVLPLLDRDDRRRGEALLGEVETLAGFEPALVHCDLGASHLLVHGGRLAGVIDWGDAKIGDPAIDYA
jgi:aminoglycoside phosphotransferase (APT) family kinase protein